MTCLRCDGATRIVRTVQSGPQDTLRVRICLDCGAVFRTRERPLDTTAEPCAEAAANRPGAARPAAR